jgi:hypothetical protein
VVASTCSPSNRGKESLTNRTTCIKCTDACLSKAANQRWLEALVLKALTMQSKPREARFEISAFWPEANIADSGAAGLEAKDDIHNQVMPPTKAALLIASATSVTCRTVVLPPGCGFAGRIIERTSWQRQVTNCDMGRSQTEEIASHAGTHSSESTTSTGLGGLAYALKAFFDQCSHSARTVVG